MTTQNKKIIHCACSLSSEGIPTPFSTILTEVYPSPPATPDENSSSSHKTIPLLISAPVENNFDTRSRPAWHTINATNQADYKEQILIESRPMINTQIDKELYSFIVKVLDGIFQTAPAVLPQLDLSQQASMWKNYSQINKTYAEAIAERYSKNDLVWIHGHGLLMVPYYLRKISPDIKIGMSFYEKFPYWENLSNIYGHDLLLKSMLQVDHIAFQTSLDTQNFETACKKFINNTSTLINKMTVFPSTLEKNTLITSSVTNQANTIQHMFPDKQIIFCKSNYVADVYRTLAAFAELLSKDQYMATHLILLLHVCPLDIPIKELESVPELVRQINHLFGTPDSVPVHFYHQEIDKEEQLALMKASHLGLFLGSHPSASILAQEFMRAHSENASPLILSSHSNLLSMIPKWGFPTLNDTDDISTITNTIHSALKADKLTTRETYEAFLHMLSENDASVLKTRFIQEVMAKTIENNSLRTKTRLLLYYDTKKSSGNPNILSYLHHLTENSNNSVWIISSQDKDHFDQWKQSSSLDLAAEGDIGLKTTFSKKWMQITNNNASNHSCLFNLNNNRNERNDQCVSATLSLEADNHSKLFITKYPAHLFSSNDDFVRYLIDHIKPDAIYCISHVEQTTSILHPLGKEIYPTTMLKNTSTLLPCN